MKNLLILKWILPIFILSLLSSCVEDELPISEKTSTLFDRKTTLSPNNSENPFDYAGIFHNEILESYQSLNYNANSLSAISLKIDSLMGNSSNGIGIFQHSEDLSIIEDIILDPLTKLDSILSASDLSVEAQLNLLDTIEQLQLLDDEPFDEIYTMMISFETTINLHPTMTIRDKEVILIVCSIIRHSLFYRIGRDEGDWDTSVGHKTAAIQGALSGLAEAVKLSIIIGVAQMENTPF